MLIAYASIFDCGASDAPSDYIVFGIPSSLIVAVSVGDKMLRYGPNLHGKIVKFESVTGQSAILTASGRLST